VPGLVALLARGAFEINDRRLHRIERGKHPCDRARPRIRIVWQQARMVLRYMENDRARLEQDEITFFIRRDLPERMKCTMRGFLHRTERKKTNVVRLAYFFKRPAHTHITRQSLAAIGDRSKAVMVMVIVKLRVVERCPAMQSFGNKKSNGRYPPRTEVR